MKTLHVLLICVILLCLISCSKDTEDFRSTDSELSLDIAFDGTSSEISSGSDGNSSEGEPNDQSQPGLVTAGEWNDLENWDFWKNLINRNDHTDKPDYWQFYTNNRIAIQLENGNKPIVDKVVALKKGTTLIWTNKTDNFGKAELWIDVFDKNTSVDLDDYAVWINDKRIDMKLKRFEDGVNKIQTEDLGTNSHRIELAFIVDATGSMGDELEFLKDDLASVIKRVSDENTALNIFTSSVFYRDEGDEYVIRKSGFSADLDKTLNFIDEQSADGGGDFPEAVHTALETGIEELQWSSDAKTRIAFLLLDAPPHHNEQIISNIHKSVEQYAAKGIKIIPITASGIDKETEFLMRFFSIITNSTYVFITDHSGIGNEHLEPSIGQYEVEQLNDLMVRLIQKYSE